MIEQTSTTRHDGSATPQWLFDSLNEQIRAQTGGGFELDAAASAWNAKCADYYDEEINALSRDWSDWLRIFCNPPFAAHLMELFVEKALDAAEQGSTVVLLLPSWTGFDWFQKLKRKAQMQDIVGPVHFENADGNKTVLNNGYRTSSVIVATLGPHVVGGTNGPPIRRPGASEQVGRVQGWSGGRSSTGGRPKLLTLNEVEPKEAEWLWDHRIPLGELTICDGDPSNNKSSFLLDLAARVSTGREMPDGSPCVQGGVLLLLGEDSIAKTVRRRLEVAGADLDRIVVPDRQVLLPRDLPFIEEAICRVSAKFVLIDPLMAFLTSDANSDQKVRLALTPLHKIAEKTNCAVVMVRHLNKRGSRHSLYRGSGSIGIIAATRSGLLIGRSPDDSNLRVLCHVKSNLGPLAPSLLFEPVDYGGVPLIEWRGECDFSADDLLSSPQPQQGKLAEAMSFLSETLAEGSVEQKEVKRRAITAGLAYRTVERAKELLGVVSERRGWGPGSQCWWRLPTGDESVHP